MPKASCGRWLLKISIKSSNLACCCRKFEAAGLVASFFKGQMHPLMAAVLLRMARPDPFDPNPQTQPPDRQLAQVEEGMLKRAWVEAKGTPLSLRMLAGRPRSLNSRSKTVKAKSSRVEDSASQVSR